jgi:hypothetical protein
MDFETILQKPENQQESRIEQEPTDKFLAESLFELSLEQLQEIPFYVINDLLKTKFPPNSNGTSHKALYEAFQIAVTDEDMVNPIELLMKEDGLWIRVCQDEEASLYEKVMQLNETLHLGGRISHALCGNCAEKLRKRSQAAIGRIRRDSQKSLSQLIKETY